jgi:hypothetical protein
MLWEKTEHGTTLFIHKMMRNEWSVRIRKTYQRSMLWEMQTMGKVVREGFHQTAAMTTRDQRHVVVQAPSHPRQEREHCLFQAHLVTESNLLKEYCA